MEGLVLKFDGWSKNIFKILFKNIDYSQWELDIKYWESYGKSTIIIDLNNIDYISSDFAKEELFTKNNEIFPEFIDLYIGFNNSKSSIKTYKDFVNSNYFLSVIIIDHRNIEICSKNEKLLNMIKDNFMLSELNNKRIKELVNIPLNSVLSSWRSKSEKGIYE